MFKNLNHKNNSWKKSVLIIFLILSVSFVGCVKKKQAPKTGSALLEQQFTEGDIHNYNIEQTIANTMSIQGRTQSQTVNMDIKISNEIKKVTEDSMLVNVTLDNLEGSIQARGSMQKIPNLNELMGKTIETVIDSKGDVKVINNKKGLEEVSQISIPQYLESLYGFLPNKTLKTGENWVEKDSTEGRNSKRTYTFKGITEDKKFGKMFTISVKSEMSVDKIVEKSGQKIHSDLAGTSESEIECSAQDGMIVSSNSHISLEGTMKMSGGMMGKEMELPMYMNIDTKITRIK